MLTAVTLFISARSLERTVRQNLMAISDAKTTQLEMFIRERRGDLIILGRSPSVMEATQHLSRAAAERAARFAGPRRGGAARPTRSSRTSSRPSAIPTPCCSTPTEHAAPAQPDLDLGSNLLTGPLRDSELAEVFDRVRTLLQVEVSDYQMYPGRSEPAAFIAGPVFNPRA